MFEKATRMKLRWPFHGVVNAEDLWDLRLEDLDRIYQVLVRAEKAKAEESLLDAKSDEDERLTLQIDIVKHVVTVRLAERDAAAAKVEADARKQKLLAVLEQKQDAALLEMSEEELQAAIDSL